jgi:ABC-2 type transport system ATP-binding protein
VAEGTPSALKAHDRGRLRLQLRVAPGCPTPALPDWANHTTRAGSSVVSTIDEVDAAHALAWAQAATADGIIEEYALAATTLEDVYIRLTGHVSANGTADPS